MGLWPLKFLSLQAPSKPGRQWLSAPNNEGGAGRQAAAGGGRRSAAQGAQLGAVVLEVGEKR